MSLEPGALFVLKKGILASVADQVAASVGGAVHRVCVVSGQEATWDECECGQLTVHHRRIWPARAFPEPLGRPEKCILPWWVAEVVVTIVRCAPETPDEQPPTCEAEEAAAEIADADIEAVQHGIECALAGTEHLLTDNVTIGPGGMCVGSQQTVLVGFKNCPRECG